MSKFELEDEVRIVTDSYWDEDAAPEGIGKSPDLGKVGIIVYIVGGGAEGYEEYEVSFDSNSYSGDGFRGSDLELVTPAAEVRKRPQEYLVNVTVGYEAAYRVKATSKAEAWKLVKDLDESDWVERGPVHMKLDSILSREEI